MAVVWAAEVSVVGSWCPGPSEKQPVQATLTHSSQSSPAMFSGQGEKTGQLNLNPRHVWSRELLARWPGKAC